MLCIYLGGEKDNFQFSIFNFQFKKLSIGPASFW